MTNLHYISLRPVAVDARPRSTACRLTHKVPRSARRDVRNTCSPLQVRIQIQTLIDHTPICCDPNVMRLCTGGELYRSTYARRNCPACENPIASKPSLSSVTFAICSATKSIWSFTFPYYSVHEQTATCCGRSTTHETGPAVLFLVLIDVHGMDEDTRVDLRNPLPELNHPGRGIRVTWSCVQSKAVAYHKHTHPCHAISPAA